MTAPLVVIGDALLDRDVEGTVERLSPDAPVPVLDEATARPRPGGAALAATLAAREHERVALVTALASDTAARELRQLLGAAGVELIDLGLDGPTPEKIRFRTGDRSLMRLDRGGPGGAVGPATARVRAAVAGAAAVLVSDYGRGLAAEPGVRAAVAVADGRVVWDPHPRGAEPPPGTTVATPNAAEVRALLPDQAAGAPSANGRPTHPPQELDALIRRAVALRRRWATHALCVTRGPEGAVVVREGQPPLAAPTTPALTGDPCGAGDRFASRLAVVLARGARIPEAVVDAVRCASEYVTAGGARTALRDRATAGVTTVGRTAVDRVRAAGGTIVATGGCFDILHAGHVQTLEAARRLGDALVVLLNSDASVRGLKGPGRPVVPQADRASLLSALGCVDAVTIFEEDTPEAALERLKPHVWVKGGDYEGAELPESEALRRWGGRAVLVPYLDGRSSTRMIEKVVQRA
jgi:rfaE bifunctional protein nucleotidyltransferase chain/domain/rfaE bifunctional protein kinase chain/domain